MTDFLSILRSTAHPQRKIFRSEGGSWKASPVSFSTFYGCEQISVSGFNDLGTCIRELAEDPMAAVISGKPLRIVEEGVVRRSKDYFEPCSHQWIMLDIDGLDDPEGRDPSSLSPSETVAAAVSYLPDEFKTAKCWYHLSSSMGIKPGIRVHLWYWLDRPVSDDEKKVWLSEYPVDKSLFQSVQLHFTADPEFVAGDDPYPDRFGLYEPSDAIEAVVVPSDLEERLIVHDRKPRHVRASRHGVYD